MITLDYGKFTYTIDWGDVIEALAILQKEYTLDELDDMSTEELGALCDEYDEQLKEHYYHTAKDADYDGRNGIE